MHDLKFNKNILVMCKICKYRYSVKFVYDWYFNLEKKNLKMF